MNNKESVKTKEKNDFGERETERKKYIERIYEQILLKRAERLKKELFLGNNNEVERHAQNTV